MRRPARNIMEIPSSDRLVGNFHPKLRVVSHNRLECPSRVHVRNFALVEDQLLCEMWMEDYHNSQVLVPGVKPVSESVDFICTASRPRNPNLFSAYHVNLALILYLSVG